MAKKEVVIEKFKPEKPKISVATTKKTLKWIENVNEGHSRWLNEYILNMCQSQCLPMSLHSNSLLSEVGRLYGSTDAFLEKLKADCPFR